MTTVEVTPIGVADLPEVAAFLVHHLEPGVDALTWDRALRAPWQGDAPNRGFALRCDGHVVGAYLGFYSSREVAGTRMQICNLGPWCVEDAHRAHGLRLLPTMLNQPGYHFTDLSPSGAVVPLNERLGFHHLDTATSLVPNLPWPSLPVRVRVTASPERLEAALRGRDLQVYRDHADLVAARHVLVSHGSENCHVMHRSDRRKGLPLFASVLHVSNQALFRRTVRHFGRHVLTHHGLPFTLAEHRVVGGPVRPSFQLRAHRAKMFRSDRLSAHDVDYLYSDLACLPW